MDGTLRTWGEALSLFEDLVSSVRLPLLLFVIHGVNLLEYDFESSTEEALGDLVRCLTRIVRSASPGGERIIKVLFTTSGLSDTLYHELDEGDIITCGSSASRVGRRSTQARQFVLY